MRLSLLPFLAVAACSAPEDFPTTVPPIGEPAEQPASSAGQPPRDQPPGDAPGEHAAGAQAPPHEGPCKATAFALERRPLIAGETVHLTGRVDYEGEAAGDLLIDVLTVPGETPPTAVYHLVCGGPGELEAELPRGLGEVMLVAYLDLTQDGPDVSDPAGLLKDGPVTVGTQDLEGLVIEIGSTAITGDYARENIVVSTSDPEPEPENPEQAPPPEQEPPEAGSDGVPMVLPTNQPAAAEPPVEGGQP
jgi:hypothetical protein